MFLSRAISVFPDIVIIPSDKCGVYFYLPEYTSI